MRYSVVQTNDMAFATDPRSVRPSDGLSALLETSRAVTEFKQDLARFWEQGFADRVEIRGFAPRVKVGRVLKQLLRQAPDLQIERVTVEGRSGCSDFVGTLRVHATNGVEDVSFTWCCRWRAEQEGWSDYFGFPDQIRAASEFDWDCFQRWDTKKHS